MLNQLRIVGGRWRGRRIQFADLPGLRPTKDAIRETLFNWLQADIVGARCVDLYAGSGALGIEALSRGAQYVDFIDTQPKVTQQIQQQLQQLEADSSQYGCHQSQAVTQLKQCTAPYDIIFLDPPFDTPDYVQTLTLINKYTGLTRHGLVYIEMPVDLQAEFQGWQWLKHKQQGQVQYGLLKPENAG